TPPRCRVPHRHAWPLPRPAPTRGGPAGWGSPQWTRRSFPERQPGLPSRRQARTRGPAPESIFSTFTFSTFSGHRPLLTPGLGVLLLQPPDVHAEASERFVPGARRLRRI